MSQGHLDLMKCLVSERAAALITAIAPGRHDTTEL